MSHFRKTFVAALLASLPAWACASLDYAISGPVEALVSIPAADGGEADEYIVRASVNARCQEGVRAFRNEDWKAAIQALKAAALENPSDDRAHFALGVAYEMTGDLDSALERYQRANLIPRQAQPMYAESVKRAKQKLAR